MHGSTNIKCGVSYDSTKQLHSELGRNLQEIKFHTGLKAAASKQTTNSNSSQTSPTTCMNSSLNWSRNCQLKSQEKFRHFYQCTKTPRQACKHRLSLGTANGSFDISATAQVAIIIKVLFPNYTTEEVLTILPLQRSTRGWDIYQAFTNFVTTTDTSLK